MLKEQCGTKYGSLHLMLQARIDSAQYMNYKVLHISTVQVSWSYAILEMLSNSACKGQYGHLTAFTRTQVKSLKTVKHS